MKDFDIASKRKILYKRKRRRKILFNSICILSLILIISFIILLKSTRQSNTYVNKKVTTSYSQDTFTVCIDPGHGDWDTGTKSTKGILEKDIVLDVSLKLGKLLEEKNINVVYTRTNDSITYLETANDSLKERIKISKIFNADLFISIHLNSNYDSTSSRGVETWYNPSKSESFNFATIIQNNLAHLNYTEDRGLKTYETEDDALAVLEKNTANPILVELGFLSNFLDERYLASNEGQDSIAEALSNAITEYLNIDNR
jgi:N-acetylmuramoyl-L-alanine amidase